MTKDVRLRAVENSDLPIFFAQQLDPEARLGVARLKYHRRQPIAFPMLKLASFMLGLLFLLGGTMGCFMLAGNRPADLAYFVPALGMGLIPIGCSIIAFGSLGPMVVLRSCAAALRCSEHTNRAEAARVISAFIGYVYGAGAFLFFASLVTLTRSFPEVSASGLTAHFSVAVAATMVSLIYTVVLAELVLRPLKQRLAGAA